MKALKFFLVTVLFALLVNGCNNPFNVVNTSEAGKLPAGKGSLYLKIAGNERTIMPAALANENFIYELIVTSIPDGKKETIKPAALETPVILDVGVYNLVVNVYDANSQLLFSGTAANIEITEGENSAAVNLQPVIGDGTGTFSWDITFPDSVSSAVMKITKRDGGTPIEIPLNNNEKTGARELTSGFYDVTIYMTGNNPDYGTITVTRKEILHIYNGRVSEYENNFADVNFEIIYEVKFFNAAAGEYIPAYVIHGDTIPDNFFDDEFLTIKGYAPPSDAFLYSGNVPSELGYTFAGWYLNNDFTEKWADDTPVTKNITIYPKWNSDAIASGFATIVNFINAPTTSGSYTLFIVADEVTLGTPSDEQPLTINSNVNLTIKSAGAAAKTINRGFNDTAYNSGLFIVENGANLTFENIIIDGQKTVFTGNKMPLVRINTGGTFTMNDGAVLRNNKADQGGGVASKGIFNMEDGATISGNTAINLDGGGGVNVLDGTFTMNGGTIGGTSPESGNDAPYGGGVFVYDGTFTMTDGTISSNISFDADGGGVFVLDGTFTMTDGTISSNTSTTHGGGVCVEGGGIFIMEGGKIELNNATYGGGVFVNYGTFTMTDGTISSNTSTTHGGGVHVEGGTFTMQGGTISGNQADENGGGVYVYGDEYVFEGTLVLGGTAVIKDNYNNSNNNDNVFLADGKYIEIGAPLTAPAEIWVTTATGHNGVIVESATSGDVPYFHADDEDKVVVFESNQLVLKDVTTGLTYILISGGANDGTYRVRRPETGTLSGELVIPAYHEGKPVTEIGSATDSLSDGAFRGAADITTVYIPATVTSIGSSAFRVCNGLESIIIPLEGVISIGEGAFSSCKKLSSITIPKGVTAIGESTFEMCESLTSISIPATVTSIGLMAFNSCKTLEDVTFAPGSSLQTIDNNAFGSCANLENITIPASVASIGNQAFISCAKLESVTFEADSQLTTIGEGAFVSCGLTGSITLPASLESIGDGAFIGLNLSNIIFAGNKLTTIGASAFSSCTSESITISAGVTTIGESAFSHWASSQTIYIEGHASEVEADAVWPGWKTLCSATRKYLQSDSTWRDQYGNSTTGP